MIDEKFRKLLVGMDDILLQTGQASEAKEFMSFVYDRALKDLHGLEVGQLATHFFVAGMAYERLGGE